MLITAMAFVGAATIAGGSAAGADTINTVLRPAAFDFTATLAGGHNVFQADGIQVSTDDAGDATASGSFALNEPLADVGEPSFEWTQTDPDGTIPPGMVMAIDFDNSGTFDASLIGEAAYNGDWWTPPDAPDFVKEGAPSCHGDWQPGDDPAEKCDGGSGSLFHGTLDDWRTAFPNAQLQTAGYRLGPDVKNAGLLTSETFGDTTYTFTKILDNTETIEEGDFDPALSDTLANGHLEFGLDDLHVFTHGTTSTDEVAEYWALDPTVSLTHAGQPELDWTGTANRPSTQLVTDFDDDGTPDGILVGEPVHGDDYWVPDTADTFVKDGAPSCHDLDGNPQMCTPGSGSPYHGTLADWARDFPQAKILDAGLLLGPSVLGNGTISAIDVGDTEYTFANTPPSAQDISKSTAFGQPVAVNLTASDDNSADTLSYTKSTPGHGVNTGTAPAITYHPNIGFAGVDSFTYTVDDGVNDPVNATVTVSVAKAVSTLDVSFLPPAPRTSADHVHAVVTVDSDGVVNGGTVTVDVGQLGGHLYTGTVSGGQANVTLGKYDGGLHQAKITFGGTNNAAGVFANRTFAVHKVVTTLGVTTNPAHIKTTTRNGKLIVTIHSPGVSKSGSTVIVKHLGSAVVKHDTAMIDLPKLSAGGHHYTAKYSGNARSAAASQGFSIIVTKG